VAVTPTRLIDEPLVPIDYELLKSFLWLEKIIRPLDLRVLQPPAVAVAASTTATTHSIDPPDGTDDEWLLLGVTIGNGGIDNTDTFSLVYTDALANVGIEVYRAQPSAFVGNLQKYPFRTQGVLASAMDPLTIPLILRRKPSKERWMYLQVNVTTTASVGARSVDPKFLYVPRRRVLS